MSGLVFMPAHQLARMMRDRTVCAVEVLDAHLVQIAKHNSKLNAVCTLDEGRARQRAKLADEALARGENWGILHGVPITIKDIFETAGLLTTAGYKRLKDYIPEQDATAVARLCAAGAIILGKTNPAELASDYQGTNDLFPRVNNPWNLNYTPGGSSSGNAAAIAAGLSPLSLYNLTGVLPTFLNPTMKGYFQALAERDRLIAQMEQALEQWDVWLCPVAMTTAFTHRPKGEAVEVDGKKVLGKTLDGLPIGMQIVGKRWREMELLAIAQELEKVIGA